MLFNSYRFIFFFLPISLVVFYQIGSKNHSNLAKCWLVLVSLAFYAWWKPIYLAFFIPSVLINYGFGIAILQQKLLWLKSKTILTIGIIFNLGLLGYFKYYNFFIDTINNVLVTNFSLVSFIIPLGISFITFEQISYLIDTVKGKNKQSNFLNYCLFITFFPKLISGPIIRYKELIPQFQKSSSFIFNSENISVGITIFMVGMFKKLVFADRLAPYTIMVYSAAENGVHLTFTEAWLGVLAHYLQLYFDFSGYSDMAIGVARMFSIKLPLNFDSPYKALNINQFWSRWHMSLTRFFRDYLYFPLSKRLKKLSLSQQQQTVVNTMITMILTGIWHGSGWNYLVWGALHGFYLSTYQIWRDWRRSRDLYTRQNKWWHNYFAWSLTFFAWIFALVLAKTKTIYASILIWRGMLGLNGISLPQSLVKKFSFFSVFGVEFNGLIPNLYSKASDILPLILLLLIVVWFTPNIQQWMGLYSPALDYFAIKKTLNWRYKVWQKLQWQPLMAWAFTTTLITLFSLWSLSLSQTDRFIYFDY